MNCPTCDHGLDFHCNESNHDYLHCPVCGTFVVVPEDDADLSDADVFVPKLVERCRGFVGPLIACQGFKGTVDEELAVAFAAATLREVTRLGITGFIYRPEDRP